MTVDGPTIVAGTMVLVLGGIGQSVWRASIALGRLSERIDGHIQEDNRRFDEIREAIATSRKKRR